MRSFRIWLASLISPELAKEAEAAGAIRKVYALSMEILHNEDDQKEWFSDWLEADAVVMAQVDWLNRSGLRPRMNHHEYLNWRDDWEDRVSLYPSYRSTNTGLVG